jgi:hypothetical protein
LVGDATYICTILNPYKAILAPSFTPAVPHDPIIAFRIVASCLNSMVDGCSTTRLGGDDPSLVCLPKRCINAPTLGTSASERAC